MSIITHGDIMKVNAQKTQVNFTTADVNTDYIKRIIKEIATQTNESESTVKKMIQEDVNDYLTNLPKAKRLSDVAKQNAVESIIFDMVKPLDVPKSKFEPEVFNKLFNYILVRNKSFLKITDPITKRKLKLSIIYTPQPAFIKQPDWVKRIDTAAASPEGDLIFNTNFVEQLSKYSLLKGVKPKGSIYESMVGQSPTITLTSNS